MHPPTARHLRSRRLGPDRRPDAAAAARSSRRRPRRRKPAKAQGVHLPVPGRRAQHIDMWDMKPDAPAEIRGPFKPIRTNVPGTMIGEHLPLLRQARRQVHDPPQPQPQRQRPQHRLPLRDDRLQGRLRRRQHAHARTTTCIPSIGSIVVARAGAADARCRRTSTCRT